MKNTKGQTLFLPVELDTTTGEAESLIDTDIFLVKVTTQLLQTLELAQKYLADMCRQTDGTIQGLELKIGNLTAYQFQSIGSRLRSTIEHEVLAWLDEEWVALQHEDLQAAMALDYVTVRLNLFGKFYLTARITEWALDLSTLMCDLETFKDGVNELKHKLQE